MRVKVQLDEHIFNFKIKEFVNNKEKFNTEAHLKDQKSTYIFKQRA
jgi:hypothetical protein